MIHVRAFPGALIAQEPVLTDYDGAGRVISVRIVRWNRDYTVTDNGVTFYRERFLTGGLNAVPVADPVRHGPPAILGHNPAHAAPGTTFAATAAVGWNGQRVGRLIRSEIRPDGLYGAVLVDDTPEAADLLARLDRGERVGISSEFDDEILTPAEGELVERANAELAQIAFVLNPQHTDAGAIAVREIPTPETEQPTMSDTPDTPTPDPTPAPAPAPAPDPVPAAPAHVREAPTPREAPRPGVARQLRSFGEFVYDAARGDIDPATVARFYRALQVGNVADIAGLITDDNQPSVIDIYRLLTPAVQAFDTAPLPDKGMNVTQPIITQRPTVARQTAEGNDVSSTKVTVGEATWPVHTYGGGQQTSIQAILRSDPSYLDVMFRLYIREMAIAIDTAVAAGVLAASDDVNVTALEYTTAAAFDELIIDASAQFLDTLHRPAEVVLISVDLWKALAKAKDADDHPLYPAINPTNRSGSMNAADAQGNIVAVTWYVEPALGGVGDGVSGVVGVRDAYRTMLGQTGQMTADVPISLERDSAVFQFVAHGKVDAAGLMKIANAT